MNIFENLENLQVSEECFNDILNIVEEIINEVSDEWKQACKDSAREKSEYFKRKYNEARDAYAENRSSKNGDKVLDAIVLSDKANRREDKLNKAIERHNRAKAEGKIKPAKKEEKEDGINK